MVADLIYRSGAGLVLDLSGAFVSLLRGFVGRLLGSVLGLVPGFLAAALDAMASIFGGIFRAVAGVFHVLFKAGIGAGLRDDGKSNGKNGGDEGGAEEFVSHSLSHGNKRFKNERWSCRQTGNSRSIPVPMPGKPLIGESFIPRAEPRWDRSMRRDAQEYN